jgi:hypothetical protein
MEFPRPVDETREETELETRLWPWAAAEKREMAGEAGAEVLRLNGESGLERTGESRASSECRGSVWVDLGMAQGARPAGVAGIGNGEEAW